MEQQSSRLYSVQANPWMGILAGAIVGVSFMFLLNILYLALGLSVFKNTSSGMNSFAVGSFILLALASFISMFAAGWIAGFFGRRPQKKLFLGEIYGFTTWGVSLIIAILLSGYIPQFLANTSYFIDRKGSIITSSDQTKTTITNPTQTNQNTVSDENTDDLDKIALSAFFIFLLGAVSAIVSSGISYRKHRDYLSDVQS